MLDEIDYQVQHFSSVLADTRTSLTLKLLTLWPSSKTRS
jgi:hypothetical protein